MFRKTSWRLVAALSLALCLAAAAPASAATYKSTRVNDVWGTMGVWGTYANFLAEWTYQSHSDGTSTVTKVEMMSDLEYGKDCTEIVCTDWSAGFTASFLTSSGSVITTIHPSGQACYGNAWPGRDRVFWQCRAGAVNLPPSAYKVKFTWSVSVETGNGIWLTAWSATKTVAIF
jgi:hypothetical protein